DGWDSTGCTIGEEAADLSLGRHADRAANQLFDCIEPDSAGSRQYSQYESALAGQHHTLCQVLLRHMAGVRGLQGGERWLVRHDLVVDPTIVQVFPKCSSNAHRRPPVVVEDRVAKALCRRH